MFLPFEKRIDHFYLFFQIWNFENTQILTHVFFQESEDANKTSEEEKK